MKGGNNFLPKRKRIKKMNEDFWKKVKEGVCWTIVFGIMLVVFIWAFETGQTKVDRWEAETGRYGEGLR